MTIFYGVIVISLLAIVFYPAYSQDYQFKTPDELGKNGWRN